MRAPNAWPRPIPSGTPVYVDRDGNITPIGTPQPSIEIKSRVLRKQVKTKNLRDVQNLYMYCLSGRTLTLNGIESLRVFGYHAQVDPRGKLWTVEISIEEAPNPPAKISKNCVGSIEELIADGWEHEVRIGRRPDYAKHASPEHRVDGPATRFREREITSLSDAGVEGQVARFIVSKTWMYDDGHPSLAPVPFAPHQPTPSGQREFSTKVMLFHDGCWQVHPDPDAQPDILKFFGEPIAGDLMGGFDPTKASLEIREIPDGIDPMEEMLRIVDGCVGIPSYAFIDALKAPKDFAISLPPAGPRGETFKVTANSGQLIVNGRRLENGENLEWISDGSRWVPVDPTQPTYKEGSAKKKYALKPGSWLAPRYLLFNLNHCISAACVTEAIYHRFYHPEDMRHWRNMLMVAGVYSGASIAVRAILELARRFHNRRPAPLGIHFRATNA